MTVISSSSSSSSALDNYDINQGDVSMADAMTDASSLSSSSSLITMYHSKSSSMGDVTSFSSSMDPELQKEQQQQQQQQQQNENQRKLGFWPLTILVFYSVSGGPFGIENAVRYGGAYYALLGFLVMPFLWSVPEALMTAELGSTFPEASGPVAWVEEAFGKRCGLFAGYMAWISGATDNAIYPALFLGYLMSALKYGLDASEMEDDDSTEISSDETHSWEFWRFVFLSCVSIVLGYMNYRGLEIVGKMAVFLSLVSISPFVIMCVTGARKVSVHRWFALPSIETGQLWNVNWRPFLNNLFWNLNSFDSGGNFSGEAIDAHTTYPRAIFTSVALVFASYMFPLLIAVGATDTTQGEWRVGHLGVICSEISGSWLGAWTVVAAAVSNLGLFEAEMSADAYQLLGMADRGMIPKIFRCRSKYGTPTYGIMLGTAVIVAMSTTHFDELVEMLNFCYCITLLFEYASFVKLRISRPEVHRPFKVPTNTIGCIAMVTPPCILIFFVMVLSSLKTLMVTGGMIVFGCAAHLALHNFGSSASQGTNAMNPGDKSYDYQGIFPSEES